MNGMVKKRLEGFPIAQVASCLGSVDIDLLARTETIVVVFGVALPSALGALAADCGLVFALPVLVRG